MSAPDPDPTSESVDLSNCDREPIHILGHVQSFGCLVAVSADWIVLHASVNIEDHLGVVAADIIGAPFRDTISSEALHDIRTRLQLLSGEDAVERIFGLKVLEGNNSVFDVAMHMSGPVIILEFEPSAKDRSFDTGAYVRPMINRVKSSDSVAGLCQTAARQVRALTGFDRVMVYKFHPDDSGEVIAEACRAGMEPFLGLRYPASDIPKQARELYRRSLLRIISDVDDKVSPVIPTVNPNGEPLDLSMSCLRAVSPIHLEYLRNMGVRASMSISILRRGKLWGLISCHHDAPRTLTYDVRSAAELFGQLFSFVLDQFETELAQEEMIRARKYHDQLMSHLADGAPLNANFSAIAAALQSVIACDGVVAWIDGQFQTTGQTPTEGEFMKLVRFLNTAAASRIYASECISGVFEPARNYADTAAGLLALPVSRTPRDYIVLFRREVARSVTWAGNPKKPVEPGPNGARLTPRKSFESWQEIVRGHCASWTDGDIGAAESLRVTLLEVVLRMADAAHRERKQNQERQELLIAELNHRVRNILNLIRGLVTQSRSDARSVREFTETVGGRIHALARAHDQITQENWSGASLVGLIQTEGQAYFGAKVEKLLIKGGDARLTPEAFSTLALVIHELMTNSAKYGALSVPAGQIDITLAAMPDGALTIEWLERNGPPVKPPTRRGFGSTVIERSVPFELKGKAEIKFETSGLQVRFMIPSIHVETFQDHAPPERANISAAPETPSAPVEALFEQPILSGKALVLEDNMIIALDAEDLLRELGATEVSTASSVSEALGVIEDGDIAFALLDVNLGSETSKPVADKLAQLGTPFLFATGYGENLPMLDDFPGALVAQKPYDKDSLREKLTRSLVTSQDGHP